MRCPSLVLSCAAVASLGCAAESAAFRNSPDFALADAGSPAAVGAGGWSEVEPTTPEARPYATSPAPAVAEEFEHHITLLAGQRWLDDDDWGDFDEPLVIGFEFDGSDTTSGSGFEVGVMYTDDEDNDVLGLSGLDGEVTTWELFAGYRYTFMQDSGESFHPFISVGGEALNAELELDSAGFDESDDDTVFGAYARAGILWDVSDRLRLGLDYRHLFAEDLEVSIAGGDIEAESDYDQVVLSLGWLY